MSVTESTTPAARGAFSSRKVFILAAIGSAVGLGNIWRFPYVAYENGGGAFIIPYIAALLTAGLPLLFLDYAIGHRFRGSPPLAFARLRRGTEGLGWWQVGICFLISVYYAAIIAWALRYMIFSINQAWGDDPETFLQGDFLQVSDPGVTMDFVPGVLVPLGLVWISLIVILGLGVQRGIGATSVFFIPVLVIAFGVLVVQALFLDGAALGLDALFTPDWSALAEPTVWAAAYGQIFFSLSVGFGIMITYASYVDRKTDMVGSGFVVGFANSGFELLAGIGVFAALGFMATASGVAVSEVASGGIGLAFVAFPTIIGQAPAGALLGILFFGSLVLAGLTSQISILEVVIASVRDKLELSRITATLVVLVPATVLSVIFFSTTSALYVLDILDHFINQFGILVVAMVAMLVMAWGVRALPMLADHLNRSASIKLGTVWRALVGLVAPIALGYVLYEAIRTDLSEPYGGYPAWMLNTFGWAAAIVVLVLGFALAMLPWRRGTSLELPDESSDTDGPASRVGGPRDNLDGKEDNS